MNEKKIKEIQKMAQIALGKQVDIKCTEWAIKEGLFDNFEAIYNAGYRKESDTAREIIKLIKRNGTLGFGGYIIHDSTIEQICKKYDVDLGDSNE